MLFTHSDHHISLGHNKFSTFIIYFIKLLITNSISAALTDIHVQNLKVHKNINHFKY